MCVTCCVTQFLPFIFVSVVHCHMPLLQLSPSVCVLCTFVMIRQEIGCSMVRQRQCEKRLKPEETKRPIHLLSENQPCKTTGPFIRLTLTTCRQARAHGGRRSPLCEKCTRCCVVVGYKQVTVNYSIETKYMHMCYVIGSCNIQ